uniref:Uncharacterized protein n=1 Tax=Panagrolaimus sp. JU765 TaxID=591449 RepID=A0AC34RB51_9BILA
MDNINAISTGKFKRTELKSHGPLSVWLHHLKKFDPTGFDANIVIKSTTFQRFFLTNSVETELKLDVNAPIWIPDNVDVIIEADNVTIVVKNEYRIDGAEEISNELKEVDVDKNKPLLFPIVVVVRCADVEKFGDCVVFKPDANAVIFVPGTNKHNIAKIFTLRSENVATANTGELLVSAIWPLSPRRRFSMLPFGPVALRDCLDNRELEHSCSYPLLHAMLDTDEHFDAAQPAKVDLRLSPFSE